MAAAGIFTIITNDGKQDRMLMATALLHDRLDQIWKNKSQRYAGTGIDADDVRVLPSLIDVEKTHILFTNAHFKPFAAIGFEYNKVRAASGPSSTLGGTIQFSIPQFGDFFHDIAFHCILSQPTVTATSGTASQNTPAMRWCTWPGERLLKKVQQEVNGNPLDEYTLHATTLHREYRVAPNKLTAWKRCVGQEEPVQGYVRQRDWANSGQVAEAFRVGADIFMGNQTPSPSKPTSMELFVPLLFWYNKDVRLAVPSVAIPYGQRFINIELAQAYELVGLVPRGTGTWASPNGTLSDPLITNIELYINNIFVNPEVHKIYIKRVGFSLIRVHRQQITTLSSNEVLLQQLKWPIEYLYVGAKVRDYYSATSAADRAMNLQVWDKFSSYSDNTLLQQGQLSVQETALVADPTTETLGLTLASGVTTLVGTASAAQALVIGSRLRVNGLELTVTEAAKAAGATLTGLVVLPSVATVTASTSIAANAAVLTKRGLEYQAKTWEPLLTSVSITAHGIDIYKEIPGKFFNAYTTYHYGGSNINAPSDPGALFVPFCLYPGTYQPSGHINVSRAREFYLNYTSAYQVANPSVTLLLVVVASAINFLLISDGSAVLRYST
jgi:hypothetical protein